MSRWEIYEVVTDVNGVDCYIKRGDIVRCKECRYCKKKRGTFKGEPITFYRCTENNRDVESDDFCSYGEREGE